ncbi:hypothetical protein TanjilG_13206 [Lupinus angustifolius]|uniref:DUF679 domain membrane protein 2 n=1 Tax=Lupinus angustifolius TaxID=3871 RepID=A0A4P1RU43_LUPAN|nr:hypothetical protein TanjilG_13206 [Lupinus angustifolius]
MVAENTTHSLNTSSSTTLTSAVGDLIKLLPTGTVFLFQFLNPIATNTDSYTATDNKRHYGIVTTKGLYPSPPNTDLSKYSLKFSDFVHAVLSLVAFAVLALLDTNTVHCFYPDFDSTQKQLLQVLPPAIGVVVGGVFMIFPNTRHGIGYPTSSDSNEDTSSKLSNDTAAAPPQIV